MPAKIIEELVPDYWLMGLRNDEANSMQFNPRQGQNSIYLLYLCGQDKSFQSRIHILYEDCILIYLCLPTPDTTQRHTCLNG